MIAGVFPLFFTGKGRYAALPILSKIGNTEDSYKKLKEWVSIGPVKLKKCLKIDFNDRLYFITSNLVPSSQYWLDRFNLTVIEETDHVTVQCCLR